MSIFGFVIVALILWVMLSFIRAARRPWSASETPEHPQVTGVAVLLCHRLADKRTFTQMQQEWVPGRSRLMAEHWENAGIRNYALVPRLKRWNFVFLLIALSRSWPIAALGSILHGLPVPARGRNRAELWDMIEVLEFPDADASRVFLASDTARAMSEDASSWTSHKQAIPMVTTRAFLRTHFAPGAIATLFCLRARPELQRAGMIDYWLDQHRPFVQGLRPTLDYAWYDQHIARGAEQLEAHANAYMPGDGPWDGVASIGYPGLRDITLGALDPRVQLANLRLLNDETRFIDLPRSAIMVGTTARVLTDLPADDSLTDQGDARSAKAGKPDRKKDTEVVSS